MNEYVIFTVPIAPYGKGRPRFMANGGIKRVYTPATTRAFESTFKLYARRAMHGRYPFDGALRVVIKAYFPIPKSYSKAKRLACEQGFERHTKKPDIDNVVKAILDAMNDTIYWDDKQVVSLAIVKLYASDGVGRIEVTVAGA